MFFVPVVASISACAYFWLLGSMDVFWRVVATALVLGALALQFTPLGEGVHFLVPTLTETVVGVWGALVIKLDQA